MRNNISYIKSGVFAVAGLVSLMFAGTAGASTITTLGVSAGTETIKYEVAFITGSYTSAYATAAPDGFDTVLPGTDTRAAAFAAALFGSDEYVAANAPSIFTIAKELVNGGTEVAFDIWSSSGFRIGQQNQSTTTFTEAIWAVFYEKEASDVGSLGGDITPTDGPTADPGVVPLPASVLLLLGGFGVLGALRRRKS